MVERFLIGDQCEVRLGRGLGGSAVTWSGLEADRVLIVTQPGAAPYAHQVAAAVGATRTVSVVQVPDGEAAKSLQSLERLLEACLAAELGRGDALVAVGGGTVSDVAGFAAATYLRGIRWAVVPTTLLGAVDAAIGGKTAVNLAGKNLVGAFHHPYLVVVDLDPLDSLPPRLLADGLAEALKTGFIGDPALVELIAGNDPGPALDEIVRRAVAVKTRVVDEDFREAGLRAVLNYGHTIGHAVETATGLRHGPAVAVGMVAAAEASARVTGFDDRARHAATIAGLGLPTAASFDPARIQALVALDKKKDASVIRMVLLRAIGDPIVTAVDDATLDAAIAAVHEGPHAAS